MITNRKISINIFQYYIYSKFKIQITLTNIIEYYAIKLMNFSVIYIKF